MPFIHVRAYPREMDVKKKTAEAIVKAASEVMGAPLEAFTVVFEDLDREAWESGGAQAVTEPLRDKMLIERGKLL